MSLLFFILLKVFEILFWSVLLTLLSFDPHTRPQSYLNNQCMLFHEILCINMRIEGYNNEFTFPEESFLSRFK